MDIAAGAGFESNVGYASRYFQIKIKLPNKDFSGVVVAFYLTSDPDGKEGNHDELDFEFLGSNGPPFTLQTNVFSNDKGGREQRFHHWFDPTSDFHTYGIVWNQHQLVLCGQDTHQGFQEQHKNWSELSIAKFVIQGSIWNGETWASGGRKTDWSQAPFVASFVGFGVTGCQFQNSASKDQCYISSPKLWWNGDKYLGLDPTQRKALQDARTKYLYDGYCSKHADIHKERQINKNISYV
ncbi:hypothetical protein ES319_A11G149300v1 [Gossypium barbadense]|uniref:GH16 domain-containing protein n=1 Tax=Gossypium barbadense TaxID=3634 RepID=A0A5J5TN29_GOSBA|nr:hypothetical protein ES319_A11G149300v1 [Gossypium barbadense]